MEQIENDKDYYINQSNIIKFSQNSLILFIVMRKIRSFQQNTIQNLQIADKFQQLLQIQGLNQSSTPKVLYPSLKHILPKSNINIIGNDSNANIRAFYYLLLCKIRNHDAKNIKQHRVTKSEVVPRQRKVSFSGKQDIFVNDHYQNYALHKLKYFAFSSNTDFSIIKNSPLQNDKRLFYKEKPLSSQQTKRLISQFIKKSLQDDYKRPSISYLLNNNKIIGVILTLLIRIVLFSIYEVEQASDFESRLSDTTIYTILCDAFAIDGLICQQSYFHIGNWSIIHVLDRFQGNFYFAELVNDDIQTKALKDDGYYEEINEKRKKRKKSQIVKPPKIDQNQEMVIAEFQQLLKEQSIESINPTHPIQTNMQNHVQKQYKNSSSSEQYHSTSSEQMVGRSSTPTFFNNKQSVSSLQSLKQEFNQSKDMSFTKYKKINTIQQIAQGCTPLSFYEKLYQISSYQGSKIKQTIS